MKRAFITKSARPLSVNGLARPMPLVCKGLGGSTSSIATKPYRKESNPPSSRVYNKQQ